MINLDYIKARVKNNDLISITREESDPPDAIQEDRINTAIADAVAIVVEKWADKYQYPWVFESNNIGTQAEARLKRIHFDIAMYFLYSLKYDDEEMKQVKMRYEKALELLMLYSSNPIGKEINYLGLSLNDDYITGFTLESFITNKLETDKKLHGIFEINS